MRERARSLLISVVTFMEIEQGASKLRGLGGARRADRLDGWLDELSSQYGQRVLAFDLPLARAAGTLGDAAFAAGRHPGFADVAIATTASSRFMTVLTRNVRHFRPLGVPVLDPFGISA